MDPLSHGAFYFWAVVLIYASWCAGAFHEARRAHKRINAMEQEIAALKKQIKQVDERRLSPLMRTAN